MHDQILSALRSNNAAEAVRLAGEWSASEPNLAAAHRWHALALQQAARNDEALVALDAALALAPEDAELHLQRAGLLLALRQFDDAGQALQQTTGLNPNALQAYLMQAHLAIARNDLDEAERQAKLAARLEPEHPEVDALQGMLALRRGELDAALARLSNAARQLPDDARVLYALGFAYLHKDMLAFAEQAFRRVLELSPQMTALQGMVVQLALRQDNFGAASDMLQQTLATPGQDSPGIRRLAAQLALRTDEPLQALEHLRPLLERGQADRNSLQLLLMAWERLGRDEEARGELDAALAVDDQSHDLWLSRLAVEPVGADGAGEVIARWLQAMPDHLPALEASVRLHDMKGDADAAEAMAERIVALQPGRASGETRLVAALLARDPAAAVARVQALADAAEGNARHDLRTWLGEVQDRAGLQRDALRTWLDLQAEEAPQRLPLPPQAKAPASWPELGEVDPQLTSRPMFLWGAPGAASERVMSALSAATPLIRVDRFQSNPPDDALQNYNTLQSLSDGSLAPEALVASWRAALPARGINDDTVIDWLPFWDNALLWALRPQLPQGRLLVVLRDPRDMLLDWIAYGSPAPTAIVNLSEAAQWLARALGQVATLHEQDLYPHVLLRIDEAGNDPHAMAQLLGSVFGRPLPPAPHLGAPRLPAGHWRNYRDAMPAAIDLLTPVAVRLGYPEA